MPDKTKKATVTKKTAPKKFKYEKLPYKDSPKLKPMEQKDITFQSPNTMQGTPFKLGSNRSNTSYSGFQAKGLISPMHQEDVKSDKDIKRDREFAMKKAEAAASRRFNESDQGRSLFNAMNASRIKEGSKPDLKGRVGIFDPSTGKPSTTNFTTIKDSKANAKAYDQALQNFLESDVEFGRQRQATYQN